MKEPIKTKTEDDVVEKKSSIPHELLEALEKAAKALMALGASEEQANKEIVDHLTPGQPNSTVLMGQADAGVAPEASPSKPEWEPSPIPPPVP